jgi:hypothetical protein
MSELYSNLAVQIERIDSSRFPEVTVELSAETRQGSALVGLESRNFVLTEGFRPVTGARLIRANTDSAPLEAVLLAEKSIAMKGFEGDAVRAAERLYGELGKGSGLQVVSAEERPRVAAAFGSSRLQVSASLRRQEWSPRWRFDLGARMATSELIPRSNRKAVVFAGVGTLPGEAFVDYSLVEVADYLKNNAVAFYVVYFGPELAPELEFLCSESGGGAYSYYAPAGLDALLVDMQQRISSRYNLRYTSRADARFGLNYIELRAEVVLHRKSGREASGYYAPLSD